MDCFKHANLEAGLAGGASFSPRGQDKFNFFLKMLCRDDCIKNIHLVNFSSYSWFKMIETRRFTQLTCLLKLLACSWFKMIETVDTYLS